VLKGDVLSSGIWCPGSSLREIGLLATLGFSARLTTGGPTFTEGSRLSSPDLRGGGGEGGCVGRSIGDFLASTIGVWGRLGILKCPGEDLPEATDVGESVER